MLSQILNHIGEALIVTDYAAKVMYLNDRAQSLSLELMDAPMRPGILMPSFHTREGSPDLADTITSLTPSTVPHQMTVSLLNRMGLSVTMDIRILPFYIDRTVSHSLLLIVMSDISEKKIFENTLIKQSRFVNDLISNSNVVIFSIDSQCHITDWNPYTAKVTGFEKSEVYARTARLVLFDDAERHHFDRYVDDLMRFEHPGAIELPIKTKSGARRIILLSGTPHQSVHGTAVGLTFVGQDVTEKNDYQRSLEIKVEERTRKLQQALTKEQEAVQIKSRFVAMASHELRNPLSTIRDSIRSVRDPKTSNSPKKLQHTLDEIERQVVHMTSVLEDVLNFDRDDQPKIKLIPSAVNLRDTLRQIVADIEAATGHTHKIDVSFKNSPESITTDEKLLRNILTNLLTNAIKFSPGKTEVFLGIEGTPEKLLLRIQDYGIGIPAEEITKVFEPFNRGKNASHIDGTGLGLSIVKKTTELLNGRLDVESREGLGSIFTLSLPIQ